MATGKFNTIVILDCLPEDQRYSSRNLLQALTDIATYRSELLEVEIFRIETNEDLIHTLSALDERTKSSEFLPSLHFEAHGTADEKGLIIAQQEFCSWTQLKELLTPLNVSSGLNLMVMFASCYGGSFANSIRLGDPAPVWGLIGPTGSIDVGAVLDGFKAFYDAFFDETRKLSPIEALNANVKKSSYFATTAEIFFYNVWANYRLIQCSPERLESRARDIQISRTNLDIEPDSLENIQQQILDTNLKTFEKARDTFFMYDIYPENQEVFNVTYEKAEDEVLKISISG